MPDYRKAFRATERELRSTQKPNRQRDWGALDTYDEYSPEGTNTSNALNEAAARLRKNGDYPVGRVYDNASFYTEARKQRDARSNQANQGKPRSR